MGAYLCIWPDKVYYNTKNPEDKGRMDALTEITSGVVTMNLCRNDGTNYDMTSIAVQMTAPDSLPMDSCGSTQARAIIP